MHTSTGESIQFENWLEGRAPVYHNKWMSVRCSIVLQEGKWTTLHCLSKRPYICEFLDFAGDLPANPPPIKIQQLLTYMTTELLANSDLCQPLIM